MHRFFTQQINGDTAQITGEDVRHIVKVLRLHSGDAVTLCDGMGRECSGVITSLSNEEVVCSVGPLSPCQSEPSCQVTLFQCLPKAGKMELIVQKATELGAVGVIPVLSRRCVSQPSGNFSNKATRYQRVALEAAKQSRRGIVPIFGELQPLDKLDITPFDAFFVAYEEEHAATLKSLIRSRERLDRVGILIGPEGGFEAHEIEQLRSRGAIPVSLGPRILRTETAGLAMLAQILYEVEP